MTAFLNLPRHFPDGATFAKAVSDAIRAHKKATGKDAWHYLECTVQSGTQMLAVVLKTWGRSYPQRLDVDGVRYGGAMDMGPKAFAALLERATTRKTYTVTVNGFVLAECTDLHQAHCIAEERWNRGEAHMQVTDETGAIIAEFEV